MKKQYTPYFLAVVAALATFALYLPALWNDFVWDDYQYIVNNQHIRPLDWAFFRWAATDASISYWHPLTWISHAIDYAFWGANPLWHHLTSILLHAVNTFLVVIMIVRLLEAENETALRSGRPGLGERAMLIAGGVTGMLFGLHPLHVESVVWVAERKDLLYAFFTLLSIMAYTEYVREVREGSGLSAWREIFANRNYLMALGLFACALMSKPMAVTLPVVLLLLDWHPFGRISSWRDVVGALWSKRAFFAMSLVVSLVTVWAQRENGALVSLAGMPMVSRLLLAIKAPFFYLGKMIAPVGLSPLYPVPDDPSVFAVEYLTYVVLMIAVTAGCIMSAKKWIAPSVAGAFYLVTLMPVLGIVRVGAVSMADRYTYLPSLGPFLLAGLVASRVWERARSSVRWRSVLPRMILTMAIVAVISMAYGTLKQIGVWNNELGFWTSIIEKDPDRAVIAYNNRAMAFKKKGESDRALDDLNTAIHLNPRYTGPYINRALYYLDIGQVERALDDLNSAIAANPDLAGTYYNRGLMMRKIGSLDLALSDLTRAITLDRSDAISYLMRGLTWGDTGQYARAIEDLTESIRLRSDSAEAYIYRGIAFKELGQYDRALEDYTRAIALRPSDAEAYNNRGVVYKHLGELDLAIAGYTKAIELNPFFSLAYCNRGAALNIMGHADAAIEDYSKAISLQQDLMRAYLERGDVQISKGNKQLARKDYKKACELGAAAGCEAARRMEK